MIEKALAGLNPPQNQGQSYYFQLYPLSLTIIGQESSVPAPGTTYRFTIFKGQQKFDQTKLPIESNYKNINGVNLMVMPKCPINFYTPTFIKGRKAEFLFKMFQYQESEEYFIADYIIDIQPYVNDYKSSRTVRFEHKSKFSEDYELQFEIYVQKSRFALQKVVKDYKHERSLKSPLRQRKQVSPKHQVKRFSPEKKTLTGQESSKIEKLSSSNQPDKLQRQEATEMTESRNKKLQEQQKSLKEESKRVSVRNSRSSHQLLQVSKGVTPQTKKENKASEIQQAVYYERKEQNLSHQKSVKNYSEKIGEKGLSETSSLKKVPIINTRLKQIAKEGTPGQIKLSERQRVGSSQNVPQKAQEVQPAKKENSKTKQQLLLALFFLVSMFLIYHSMHPNKKV